MSPKKKTLREDAALRRRAEERLLAKAPTPQESDPRRILHELQVHQIQLEMQNAELRAARSNLEFLVEKYTDLYDFAPVGYFSLDMAGRVMEVNLTGAAMLGIERSRLLHRLFNSFVSSRDRAAFTTFLTDVFADGGRKDWEVALEGETGGVLWVDLQGTRASQPNEAESFCRLAVSDITALKRAAEAQSRADALKAINDALELEVSRRKVTEKSLRESKRRQSRLLMESQEMQKQLRLLSREVLHVQEEERKRISLDLHDEIAQTLVAINVHLASLARDAAEGSDRIYGKIIETQKLVEQSVDSVHRFAMGLRPTLLDDLGLIPALRAGAAEFTQQTELPVNLDVPTKLPPLDDAYAVALYRIAQAALSNVARHAEATEVHIALRRTQGALHLKISDNGKSFDVEGPRPGEKSDRLGLIGMRERAEMVGGRFGISSSPEKGTTVSVRLPFKSGDQARDSTKEP